MNKEIPTSRTSRPWALVTGASRGIGADLARELARDGHDLVLVARSVESMEKLARELETIGARSLVISQDLSLPGAANRLVEEVETRSLTIDVLINNAGFGHLARFQDADAEKISSMLRLNVIFLTELTKRLVSKMVERGQGKIMLVASTASFQAVPHMAVYAATKAYVLSLGEALAVELQGTGVSATTLCPGPTRTGFASVAGAEDSFVFRRKLGLMESAEVAKRGYRGLKRHRWTVVTGATNRIAAIGSRLVPRSFAAKAAGHLMAGRNSTKDRG